MIDAGSAGSRLHVYRFRQCAQEDIAEFEDEVLFVQTIPGLSAYGDEPYKAAESLDPLLRKALDIIPQPSHQKTPVAVKATAGLRLLGEEKSERVLDSVFHHMKEHYPFQIVGGRKEGVAIMDGRDEGVYAWITVNFLLGNLKSPTLPTAAVFDLGGGSTQIVFEPEREDLLAEGDHKYTLRYDGRNYTLYQHSYLGYGLMEARKRMHQRLLELAADEASSHVLPHPCLPRDLHFNFPKNDPNPVVTFVGGGEHDACADIALDILNKNKMCLAPPCSFDGIHQPPIADAFQNGSIYIFSYFYDRTQPLGLPDQFRLPELQALTEQVCAGEYLERLPHGEPLREEMLDRPEWCLDLAFIHGLLSHGYEIPPDREIRVAKKIDGIETGWCLGAAIALLDSIGLY
ncbi:nucleoside phosphatase GDA1/CD39 [Dichotomocladium elegans]|nr:nucleoside phosphatase GDA1/CD39 [Dichotomocladium elegans]